MAFFSRAGSILKHTVHNKHINHEISAASSSIFQTIRCMSSKLFVGGLSYATDEPSLTEAFQPYGAVQEARVIVDRETGRSRGFGFVTYYDEESASAAIQALDGRDIQGRTVRVNYANDRSPGGGGAYSGGGNGFGGVGGYSSGFGSGFGAGDGYGGNTYRNTGTGGNGSFDTSSAGGNYGGENQNFGVTNSAGGGDNNYGGYGSNQTYASGGRFNSGSQHGDDDSGYMVDSDVGSVSGGGGDFGGGDCGGGDF